MQCVSASRPISQPVPCTHTYIHTHLEEDRSDVRVAAVGLVVEVVVVEEVMVMGGSCSWLSTDSRCLRA